MLAALGCAVLLPRAVALRGLDLTAPLEFPDAICHLYNVDLLHKVSSGAGQEDPFLLAHPEHAVPQNPAALAPAVYAVARLWVGWSGPLGLWTTQLTNLLFLAVMLIGVAGLGRALGSTRAGLLAALLTALCPALAAGSWYFSSDFPLAACTTVGLWLLMKTGGLRRPAPAAALAIWSVVGCLVKMTYALYLLFPTLAVLVMGLTRGMAPRAATRARSGNSPPPPGGARSSRVLAVTSGALLLFGVLLLLAGGDGLERDLILLKMHLGPSAVEPHFGGFQAIPALSVRGVLSVPAFLAMHMPLPLLLLTLPGLAALHRRPRHGNGWVLAAFLWGVYLFATLFPHRQARYILPLYPVLCLAAAWWVEVKLPARWRRLASSGLVIAFAATLVLAHIHPTPWGLNRDTWPTTALMSMPGAERLAALRAAPGEPDLRCKYKDLVRAVEELARVEGSTNIVGIAGKLPAPGDIEITALLAGHRLRRRLVSFFHLEHHDARDLPRALVLFHEPGRDPPARLAGRRARRTVAARLICGDRVSELAGSLMLPEE